MSPFFGAYHWFRKPSETLSIHDGLFQIGYQAYHILVREPGDVAASHSDRLLDNDTADDQVVVLIPTPKRPPLTVRGRLSVSM